MAPQHDGRLVMYKITMNLSKMSPAKLRVMTGLLAEAGYQVDGDEVDLKMSQFDGAPAVAKEIVWFSKLSKKAEDIVSGGTDA